MTQAAQDYLADTPALAEPLQGRIAILNRVTRLIEGYESPYSLEIMAIAHWVMQALPQATANVEQAIPFLRNASRTEGCANAAVEECQPGQRRSFKPQHVKQAWQRLHEQQWLLTAEPV